MTTEKILDIVLREIAACGEAWRQDWSDFDGRTLRHQMNDIQKWAASAPELPETADYTAMTDWLNEILEDRR